jgi:hypothetical protein
MTMGKADEYSQSFFVQRGTPQAILHHVLRIVECLIGQLSAGTYALSQIRT